MFQVVFNKLAFKMTTSLNDEDYDHYLILSEQMDNLITKHQYSHQINDYI